MQILERLGIFSHFAGIREFVLESVVQGHQNLVSHPLTTTTTTTATATHATCATFNPEESPATVLTDLLQQAARYPDKVHFQ